MIAGIDAFFSKYRILLPLVGFIFGILLKEWIGNEWVVIPIFAILTGAASLLKPKLVFLIFIPLGILFSVKTLLPPEHITYFLGKKADVEGVLFRSPESREKGSRLFIDVKAVFVGGKYNQASGRVIVTSQERISGLAYGDRIRVIGIKLRPVKSFLNPGSFDIKGYYERQGIYATGFVPGDRWIISFARDKSSNFFLHSLDRLRDRFRSFIRSKSSHLRGEMINALTIGDKGGIPVAWREKFSEAGIAHLFSISGLHVGAVALVFYLSIKWILKRSQYLLLRFQVPRVAAALTIIPILLYTALAGFAHPVTRAFIMATVYLVSIVIGRAENKFNTLGVAAFIVLLWHPGALFELSFQLSFSSVLGILLMHKFYPLKFLSFGDKIISSIKTTVAATLITLPFIINSFGVLPVISIPANLIFVPLVEFLIVPLSLLSFLVFVLSQFFASPLVYIDEVLVGLLLWGVDLLLKIPFSSLTVPQLPNLSWIFYALAALPLLLWRTSPRLRPVLPLCLLGFIVTSVYFLRENRNTGLLEVNFLDAGNRNMVLVNLPGKRTIVLDGGFSYYDQGGYMERSVLIPFLLESGITKIDYLILTSLDKDHVQGIKDVLRKLRVERLWTNGGKLDGTLWQIVKDGKITWKNILDDVEDFEIEGVTIEFIKPRGDFKLRDSARPYPIVLKLTLGQVSVILGEGLAEEQVQGELLEIYRDRLIEGVLHLPGIISREGLSFILRISPSVLVMNNSSSAGEVLPKAISPGVPAFQTDKLGTVTVLTDGKEIRVRTFVDENEDLIH